MPMPKTIILRIWEGDFGVASVEPDSLTLLTLLKIYHVNVRVRYASVPQWHTIPSLQLENINITKHSEVFMAAIKLCKSEFDMDVVLQSQIIVYKTYFMESFAPAFFIDCWIQEINFDYMTKTWYDNAIPFPFNYFYLKKKRQEAKNRFEQMVGRHSPFKCIVQHHDKADRCLKDFATMLNDDRPYLLGTTPTSLDAVVYSYLVITLNMPLPDPALQNIVKGHKNLMRFVRNMTQKYYPELSLKYKYVEPLNSSTECASTKSLVIAGLCASTAMFVYAYANGLINPKIPRLKFF